MPILNPQRLELLFIVNINLFQIPSQHILYVII